VKDIITPFKVGVVVLVGRHRPSGCSDRCARASATTQRLPGLRVFDDVSGLVEKSRITIAGINVGQIDKIELVGERARVWIRVNTPLRADARISKKQASLLGEYYLQLTPGATRRPARRRRRDQEHPDGHRAGGPHRTSSRSSPKTSEITGSVRAVVAARGEQKLARSSTTSTPAWPRSTG
jgi:hypothetical protein